MGIKVLVNSTPGTRVSINSQARETIRTVGVGAGLQTNSSLRDLIDVIAINPANNDVLVYDASLGKYVVKTVPTTDGGTF
jgi:hypothetical protein